MIDSDLWSFEWLIGSPGVVDVDIDSEEPTRWRVELATAEHAELLIGKLTLIGCAYTLRSPTVVIIEPEGH